MPAVRPRPPGVVRFLAQLTALHVSQQRSVLSSRSARLSNGVPARRGTHAQGRRPAGATMPVVFEKRRPATPDEIARLVASLDVIELPAVIFEAEVSEVATVAQLASLHTVLGVSNPAPGADRFQTVAEIERIWAAGGGDPVRDQESYQFHLARARADPSFAPELLFEPTRSVTSGWWMIDGIHRAVALLTARTASATTPLHLPVFVLPRPLS